MKPNSSHITTDISRAAFSFKAITLKSLTMRFTVVAAAVAVVVFSDVVVIVVVAVVDVVAVVVVVVVVGVAVYM